MWTKSYSLVTKEVTKEQMWKLFSDVNNWHTWDNGIEYAKLEGKFEKGNFFLLKPKGCPELKVKLTDMTPLRRFIDVTSFPLAKMYDDHQFEETPDGLKITGTLTVKGPLGFLWRKIVAEGMFKSMPSDMLKQVKAASRL